MCNFGLFNQVDFITNSMQLLLIHLVFHVHIGFAWLFIAALFSLGIYCGVKVLKVIVHVPPYLSQKRS